MPSGKKAKVAGMLVAQTSAGIARVHGTRYEILDCGSATLGSLIRTGDLRRLEDATLVKTLDADQVVVRAPLRRPARLVIVGLNYRDHAVELGAELPTLPRIHVISPSVFTGTGDVIPLPSLAPDEVDFEGEMAIVIGRPAVEVAEADAWACVAAVTVANDVTARDVQFGRNSQVAGPNVGLAKAFDGFKPIGPSLLLTGGAPLDGDRTIRTRVDGELRQDSDTGQMHFPVPELVAYASRFGALQPGDVILTGTPGGVGLATEDFLARGQSVEVEVEGIGVLRNTVAAAPPATH